MPVLLTHVTDTSDAADVEQLEKIYTDAQPERLAQLPGVSTPAAFVDSILKNPELSFYCGLFNDRLIAALVVSKADDSWQISHLCVRNVTRRRGVGSRLLTLVIEAAKAEGKLIRILSESLMTPDHIILQRMGYTLSENGDCYTLALR